MVREGDFTVELIHAKSKEPFPEHTGLDNKPYVEVEPDTEYFIRIKSHSDDLVFCNFFVDGKDLGYHSYVSPGRSTEKGLWSRVEGEETFQALKFVKASVLNHVQGNGKPWTGCIEVKFSEAVEDGVRMQRDHAGNWTGGEVGSVVGGLKKKGVRSLEGILSTKMETKRQRRMHYRSGNILEHIQVQYCTTVGLIENDLLPKPPGWDLRRLQELKPATVNPSAPHMKLKPQEFILTDDGAKALGIPEKRYELFDLSTLDDADADADADADGDDDTTGFPTQTVEGPDCIVAASDPAKKSPDTKSVAASDTAKSPATSAAASGSISNGQDSVSQNKKVAAEEDFTLTQVTQPL